MFLILRLAVKSEVPRIIRIHKFQVEARFIPTEMCCATLFTEDKCPLLSRALHSSGQDVGRNPTGLKCIWLILEIIFESLIFPLQLSAHINLLIATKALWISL